MGAGTWYLKALCLLVCVLVCLQWIQSRAYCARMVHFPAFVCVSVCLWGNAVNAVNRTGLGRPLGSPVRIGLLAPGPGVEPQHWLHRPYPRVAWMPWFESRVCVHFQ